MPENDPEYDFEKLAREIVISRLGALEGAPSAAAEIAKKIIVTGIRSTKVRQDPHMTVVAVCKGVLGGMLVLNKDLAETSVKVLKEIPQIAHEVPIDPSDLMTWGMEGIASVALMAGDAARSSIQERIEESFMGAGAVFSRLCSRPA
jgi:hypothetical protein